MLISGRLSSKNNSYYRVSAWPDPDILFNHHTLGGKSFYRRRKKKKEEEESERIERLRNLPKIT